MKKTLVILFLSLSTVLSSQTILTIEGQTYINTLTGNWNGVEIVKQTPTLLTFRNNTITCASSDGYFLMAGDETSAITKNNLDGAVITGNKLTWNGTIDRGQHGLFVGYNKNDIVQYNYLDKVPYGIVYKSGNPNMICTSGGFAYNIVKNSDIGVRIKGINGVCVYNNTFYDDIHSNVPAIIYITNNPDVLNPTGSSGTKIKNNIFYTTHQILNIYVEEGCEVGFESDYNVFYCKSGSPMFQYHGAQKTYTQWQALGYDLHSHVVNPDFVNSNTLVPATRLDYGTNLGVTWDDGISISATWGTTDPASVKQNGIWQIGARIYDAPSVNPYYVSSAIQNATPSVLEISYNLILADVVPSSAAFSVMVNSAPRTVNTVAISGTKVLLTLANTVIYGDVVTVAYNKPATNPLQTASGGLAATISAQPVVNYCTPPANQPPVITISSPTKGSSYTSPVSINIVVNVSDPDGTIRKVEFFNGSIKYGELTAAPYSYTLKDLNAGTYTLIAVATDNLDATSSDSVEVKVNSGYEANTEILNLYPNPNDGHFSINLISPVQKKNMINIFDYAGRVVYMGTMLKEENYKELDVSLIYSGVYILMLNNNEILCAKKFIKK